jgi:hypothetical protein
MRHPNEQAGDDADANPMARRDTVNLVLYRAGVRVDIDAGRI